MQTLISLIKPDESLSEHVWNGVAIAESLVQFAKLSQQTTGYVYVARDRELNEARIGWANGSKSFNVRRLKSVQHHECGAA
jgi:hypothetical protein